MCYTIQFKDRLKTEEKAREYISYLVKDGWGKDHFEIIEVC